MIRPSQRGPSAFGPQPLNDEAEVLDLQVVRDRRARQGNRMLNGKREGAEAEAHRRAEGVSEHAPSLASLRQGKIIERLGNAEIGY